MILPGELIDLIIGFLHSSPSTLLNCSMVQRSWTHIARVHLLHKLSLCLSRYETLSILTSLIECISTDPLLPQHVSILELRETRPSEYLYAQQDAAVPVEYLLLASLLTQMTCVQELRLIAFDWANLPKIVSSAVLAFLSTSRVSTLHLEFFRINSSTELARLISLIKDLKTLRLVQLYAFQHLNTDGTITKFVTAGRKGGAVLHSLELGTMLDFRLLNTFICTENKLDFSALRKLCLVHANHPSALKELVKVGMAIEELILSVKTLSEPPVPFDLSLASLPKLLRLELTDGITQEAMGSLFGSLKGPHPLREIIVHEDWLGHSLKAAQTYYLQPELGALVRVEYRIIDNDTWKVRHVYQEAFAILCERGIFSMVQEESKAPWPRWGLPRYT